MTTQAEDTWAEALTLAAEERRLPQWMRDVLRIAAAQAVALEPAEEAAGPDTAQFIYFH